MAAAQPRTDNLVKQAQATAQRHDYTKELALAGNDYTELDECVAEVARAASVLRTEWMITGDTRYLADALSLDVKVALLDGLLDIRRAPQEWCSEAGVVSPESLARVLPLFSRALLLCRTQPQALWFPTDCFRFALAHLQKQVAQSLASLASGTWQITSEGQQYAQMRLAHAVQMPAIGWPHPLQAQPDPFAGLRAACHNLGGVLDQLQAALLHAAVRQASLAQVPVASLPGIHAPHWPTPPVLTVAMPAGPQAWTRSFKAALATGLPPAGQLRPRPPQRSAQRSPAALPPQEPGGASSRPAQSGTGAPQGSARRRGRGGPDPRRGRRPADVPAAVRPAAITAPRTGPSPDLPHRHDPAVPARPGAHDLTPAPSVETAPGLSSSPPPGLQVEAAPVAAAAPLVDPAAEAMARQREQQFARLRTEYEQLHAEAELLADPTRAHDTPDTPPAGAPRWAGPSSEFHAWQVLAGRWQDCAAQLTDWANSDAGRDHPEAEVRSLRREIATASGHALRQAENAAHATLAAFAQTCHVALVEGDPERAGVDSFLHLAAHSAQLRQEWADAPMRPRLPGLIGSMRQYDAYETVCRVIDRPAATTQEALSDARKLGHAAEWSERTRKDTQGALAERLAEFHRFCKDTRDNRLRDAARMTVEATREKRGKLGERLAPALERSRELAAAYDVLLVGDPLPHSQAAAASARTWYSPPPADLRLAQEAHRVYKEARQWYEQLDSLDPPDRTSKELDTLHMPADAPEQARKDLEAARMAALQMQLSAGIAHEQINGYHDLARHLAQPDPRHQVVREQVRSVKEDATPLDQALKVINHLLSAKVIGPHAMDLMTACATGLRGDLRLLDNVQKSLGVLETLLIARKSAALELGQLGQIGNTATLTGATHDGLARDLTEGMAWLAGVLESEREILDPDTWNGEKRALDQTASALGLRIRCERELIRSRMLLTVSNEEWGPDLDRPAQREQMEECRASAATEAGELAQVNRALDQLAATSPVHAPACRQQADINTAVRRELVTLQLKLARRLAAAPDAGQAAGGSGPRTPPDGTAGSTS